MKQIIVDEIKTQYYITEDGECYNSKRENFLKGQISNSGYLNYNLTFPDGRKKRLYAHRLVAQAYIFNDDPKNKKQVNHKDGNKLNNNINNLEWVTAEENSNHAIQTGLKSTKTVYCFDKDLNLVKSYLNAEVAAKEIGTLSGTLYKELRKEEKILTLGYYWSYDKEIKKVKKLHNIGKAKAVCQYTMNGEFIAEYDSTGEAGRVLGIIRSHISECCQGKLKSYKGFIWKYKEDIV